MTVTQLESTARALVSSGKGILAADESHPTLGRRFSALGIENTAESRRVYRQMMFTTPGVADSHTQAVGHHAAGRAQLCCGGRRAVSTNTITHI